MRRGNLLLCLAGFFLLAAAVHACSTLISLLFEDGQADAILGCDIPSLDDDDDSQYGNGTQLIPKIIHQTYITTSIPEHWQAGQQACVDLHPDYEYKLWTDAASREFIAERYSWFLPTFDSYPYPIQRADAIRYFILEHYGGIYIDLDDGCNRRLDPLLSYPAWLRFTTPTGISNDAMGSVPNHPFFRTVIESLEHYNRNWLVSYITVMYSTGPLFLSVVWKQYINTVVSTSDQVRILMPNEYSKSPFGDAFFNIAKGSSWHGEDAKTIFWMGRHWLVITMAGIVAAGCLAFALYVTCAKCEKMENRGKLMLPMSSTRRISSHWPFSSREESEKQYYETIGRLA